MFAVVAAVLALAGAPANTPVVCNPALAGTAGGITHAGIAQPYIELSPIGCAAIMLVSLSPAERKRVDELNPAPEFNLEQWIGIGLKYLVHEAYHVGLNSGDEGVVECDAMRALPAVLARWGTNAETEMRWAQSNHDSLSAQYRRVC